MSIFWIEAHDRINIEIDAMIAEIVRKENDIIKCRGKGWLKPHKQLKPSHNSKINYNLPRGRIREKKKIFLLKAAA